MDSILILELDRIYWINRILNISGFRMKPGIGNQLRGKIASLNRGTVIIYYLS